MPLGSAVVPLILTAMLASCAPSKSGAPMLGAPETFDWSGVELEFAPPHSGWRREGQLSGGLRGVRFIREHGTGEVIEVAESIAAADRDRGRLLDDVIRDIETLDDRALRRAIDQARWRTDSPLTDAEASAAPRVNAALDEAVAALARDDRSGVRWAVERARNECDLPELTLEEAVALARVRAEQFRIARYEESASRTLTSAGEPAHLVDFTLAVDGRVLRCRQLVVVHGRRIFVMSLQGREEDLPLFDAVTASLRFPDSAPAVTP